MIARAIFGAIATLSAMYAACAFVAWDINFLSGMGSWDRSDRFGALYVICIVGGLGIALGPAIPRAYFRRAGGARS